MKARARPGRRTRASSSFGNKCAQPHTPSAPRRLDGITIQSGGGRPIAAPEASEDDLAWFERHPARRHRLRHPIGGERALAHGIKPGFTSLIAIREIREGVRIRLPVGAADPMAAMLNSEALARSAFEFAAAGAPVTAEIEAKLRERAA